MTQMRGKNHKNEKRTICFGTIGKKARKGSAISREQIEAATKKYLKSGKKIDRTPEIEVPDIYQYVNQTPLELEDLEEIGLSEDAARYNLV